MDSLIKVDFKLFIDKSQGVDGSNVANFICKLYAKEIELCGKLLSMCVCEMSKPFKSGCLLS